MSAPYEYTPLERAIIIAWMRDWFRHWRPSRSAWKLYARLRARGPHYRTCPSEPELARIREEKEQQP